jgi:hypothetical protein
MTDAGALAFSTFLHNPANYRVRKYMLSALARGVRRRVESGIGYAEF